MTKVISKDDLSEKVDKMIDSASSRCDHKAIQLMATTKGEINEGKISGDKQSVFIQALNNLRRREYFKGHRGRAPQYGGVASAEKHSLDPTEHLHMIDQQKAGVDWFLTPPI